MRTPAKFLFDNDFGRSTRPPGAVQLAEHQLALTEAESRGYRNGYAAAQAEAAAANERQMAAALGRAAASLQALARGLAATQAQLEAEAVEVAVAVASRLASALVAREPLAEMAALVSDCLMHLAGTPHVVVRVNEGIYDAASSKLQELAAAAGFGGRLIVMGEPSVAPGDCRVEWAEGGAIRDRAAVAALIAQAVERYLAARTGGPATEMHAGADFDG